jgi:hypothetical protein
LLSDATLNWSLPRIGCDFNAFGLSDENDDTCFYSFDRSQINILPALTGATIILFDYDSEAEIVACEAILERFRTGWREEPEHSFWYCGFRARPVKNAWYWGKIQWEQMK